MPSADDGHDYDIGFVETVRRLDWDVVDYYY